MGLRKSVGMVCVVATLAGCKGFATEIVNRQPLSPLPAYEEWWAATESCSGRTGELGMISWFTAVGITSDEVLAFGLWRPPHEIVIVKGYEDNETIVRHEMLHDLLDGDSDHTSVYWESCKLILGR